MRLPDDLRHPSGGEQVDELTNSILKLAHEAIDRFPEVKRRHMFMAGGAAISSAAIVAAGVAIMHRIRAGANPEDAVQAVTAEEIEGIRLVEREHYRPNGVTEDGAVPDASSDDAPAQSGSEDADRDATSGTTTGTIPESRAAGL